MKSNAVEMTQDNELSYDTPYKRKLTMDLIQGVSSLAEEYDQILKNE